MIEISTIAIILSLIVFSLLLGAYVTARPCKEEDLNIAKLDELTQMVLEGVTRYFRQLFFYAAWGFLVILIGLAFIFKLQLVDHLNQVFAFLTASVCMIAYVLVGVATIPRHLKRTVSESHGYFRQTNQALFGWSHWLSGIQIGFLVAGLAFCLVFFGAQSFLGFGLALVILSLYLRIGGSLYKTSAELALVMGQHRHESLPEIDRRNPGTLINQAGYLISDVFGHSADLTTSMILAMMATIFFAASKSLFLSSHLTQIAVLPIITLLISFTISAIASVCFKRFYPKTNLFIATIYASVMSCGIGIFFYLHYFSIEAVTALKITSTLALFGSFSAGLFAALLLANATDYLSSRKFPPLLQLLKRLHFGESYALLGTIGNGFITQIFYLVLLGAVITIAYWLSGIYGILFATVGMLAVFPVILTFSISKPLSQVTQCLAVIAGIESGESSENLNELRNRSRSAAAIGNHFSLFVAVLVSIVLLISLLPFNQISLFPFQINGSHVLGMMVGTILMILMIGVLTKSVTQISWLIEEESKRQIHGIPYLLADKGRPDIVRAAKLIANAVIVRLVILSVVVIIIPGACAFFFDAHFLLGFYFSLYLFGFVYVFQWATIGNNLTFSKWLIEYGHFGGTESKNYIILRDIYPYGIVLSEVLSAAITMFIKISCGIGLLVVYSIS